MRSINFIPLVLLVTVHFANAQATAFSLHTSSDQEGQFVQEKHLTVLTQPFVTKGNYHYQKNIGLIWHTQQPVESKIKITTEGVSERQADGHFKSLTSSSQFSELLLALFSGEQQSLQQQFYIEQQDNRLTLTPKSAQIAGVILKISLLIKDNGIQQIVLYEPEGNYTNIFLNQLKSPSGQD
ncbi:outer membrane lipoprotein carrier protein LolA [uncultured Paraglaciecola sp.]|uniref:outer membrane lipoprotein carrier protein LolA n=1 Tax=uncultured Paraglaciecola sp. TaxID=1765024 RepID=UPI0030DC484A|tara:strand:+ start:40822 stop:41367 length:546 start_codon:yes stop_codon:yes gene_type:complete